jgi:RimJ/RimL family protein N-acetyltransferase
MMAENNQPGRPIFPYQVEKIVTSRLILRPMCDEDIEYFYEIRTRPEVMKWT